MLKDNRANNKKKELQKKLVLKQQNKEKTICLCMIVKNESKNIIRLFDSLIGIIDFISIVDTGCIDNTVELIEEWSKKQNIPYKIHYRDFTNFGESRTHSYKSALKSFNQADFLLLSDADFIWEKNEDLHFNKKLLLNTKYYVLQKTKVSSYWNTRMISTKVKWICKGVTHEFWTCENHDDVKSNPPIMIESLRINDVDDGGCKENKFERDKMLLLKDLNENPNLENDLKIRYHFYLGQTFKSLEDYENAIIFFQKRIDLGGWEEEVYYSIYQMATCQERNTANLVHCNSVMNNKPVEEYSENDKKLIEKWGIKDLPSEVIASKIEENYDKAHNIYMEAYNRRKIRSEPLVGCIRVAYQRKNYLEMYKFIKLGMSIPQPKTEQLFIEYNIYKYMFHFYMTVVGFNISGKRQEGQDACEYLMDDYDNLPEYIQNSVKINSRYYI